MAKLGVCTVCFLLFFWTAEGFNLPMFSQRSRSAEQCSIWFCILPVTNLVGNARDLEEALANLRAVGVDRLCQELQSMGSCFGGLISNPECSASRQDTAMYGALSDSINYVCSTAGRRLLAESAQRSPCVTDTEKIPVVQNQLRGCDQVIQERIDSTDPEGIQEAVCSALPDYQRCVTDAVTQTCDSELGTLTDGILTRIVRRYRVFLGCNQDQHFEFADQFLGALRSLK